MIVIWALARVLRSIIEGVNKLLVLKKRHPELTILEIRDVAFIYIEEK